MSEELRRALARLDPSPAAAPVRRVEDPVAQALLEEIMSTPVIDEPVPSETRRRRTPWLAVAAAAAVIAAAAGVGIASSLGDDDSGGDSIQAAPEPVTLSVAPGNVMSSCLPFSVDVLKDMPMAFGGTVTEVSEGSVTVDVDRWYRGRPGNAEVVELQTPGSSVALDGVEFTADSKVLVAATDGQVNGCGFSGPASAQLEQAYAEAFPS